MMTSAIDLTVKRWPCRLFTALCVVAWMASSGCSDVVSPPQANGGNGGTGGAGATGGTGAAGGTGGDAGCTGVADCNDGNECTIDACNTGTGTCSNDEVSDGTPCDFMGGDGACIGGSCTSCDVVICAPDLVVTTLETTGAATVNIDNDVELPIRVVVRNQGSSGAAIFKVATFFEPGGSVRPFTVPGQSSTFYPFTSGTLAPGGEIEFSGKVTFLSSQRGQTISLTAFADSCSGDEFFPEFCRVEESNETNNESAAISETLP